MPKVLHADDEARSARPEVADRDPPRPSSKGALLASTAFVALIAGNSDALAACSGVNTANVLCDTANQATAGTLATTFAGTTTVNVNPGGKIDSGGALAQVTAPGSLTFNHNDTTFGITNTAGNGVDLNAFGAITYLGNANVTATANGILAANGSAAGNISITNNATVNAGVFGISATTANSDSILINGSGNVSSATGSAIIAAHAGTPAAGTNAIVVSGSGGATSSNSIGIDVAVTFFGNAGNVLVDRSGPVSGTTGIRAASSGTGNVTVTGGSTITSTAGAGIEVTQSNNAAGTNGGLHVGGSGSVNATGNGIDARITGANNAGSILIDRSGDVTATATGISAFILGAGATGSITVTHNGNLQTTNGRGIDAETFGSGNVLVTGAGSVFANGLGNFGIFAGSDRGAVTVTGSGAVTATASNAIVAQIFNAANNNAILVDRSGPISGSSGIFASTTGNGAITVNVSNDVTATAAGIGRAVDVGSVDGLATVNVAGGTLLSADTGISAVSSGNGGIQVNMSGGQVGTAAQRTGGPGIFTVQNGSSGDINLTLNSVFATGDAVLALFTNVATTGGASVRINAGATVSSSTAIGVDLDGGANKTIANLGAISGVVGVRSTSGRTTITNSGSITGTGGTALQLTGANNLFVMDGPGSTLAGNAIGSGTDTFRLAGSGANSFNVGQIGTGWTLLDKAGSSTWTLTGTSSYGGPTTVSAGTLLVNGSLASSNGITVAAGATLGGSGTLPSTTINGGSLSPGNSIGTITIAGNLSFVGAGNYIVEVAPASADRTNVSGNASLSGTLQAIGTGGTYIVGTRYTVLNAGGGISGTFGNLAVAGNFGLTRPHIEYDANNVYLVLDPNALTPSLPVNATPNQRAVAGAVDRAVAGGSTAAPLAALFALTAAQVPAALDQLSGEVHASTAGVLADESLYMRSAVLGRLRQASYGGDMAAMAALRLGGPQLALADGSSEDLLAYAAKSPRLPVKAPPMPPQPTSDVVFWAQGFGGWGRFDSDGNAASVRRDLAGFITGLDTRIAANGRLGIAAGYTGSRNTLDGRGSASVESGHVAAYGGWSFGAVKLRGGAAYAFHTIDADRSVVLPGFFDRLTARYDGSTAQVFGEAGYGFAFGNLAVEPFAGGAWVHLQTDAARENGGAAALNIARTTFEVGYSTLGLRAASLLPLGGDMVLVPRATLAWQHAFDSVTPQAVLALQAAPFTIAGVPIARDALLAEAGLDLAIGRNATIGVSYVGQLANNVQDHAAKGKFSWKF